MRLNCRAREGHNVTLLVGKLFGKENATAINLLSLVDCCAGPIYSKFYAVKVLTILGIMGLRRE